MDRLTNVFRDVLNRPDLEIGDLVRDDFSAWDSLAHVKLVISIEEEFGIQFTIDQVANTRSVKEFRELIARQKVI